MCFVLYSTQSACREDEQVDVFIINQLTANNSHDLTSTHHAPIILLFTDTGHSQTESVSVECLKQEFSTITQLSLSFIVPVSSCLKLVTRA